MAVDLGTSFSSLQWVVDAYALALAALVMAAGALADVRGHRRLYVAGLALFAVSSLACGLSQDAAELVTARTVQGLGAAAMFATTFALLNSSYSGRDRGVAYGMWGAVSGASSAIGPIVGGLLTQGISWRWIFFVNLPVSVAAVTLTLLVLPLDNPIRGRRVDVPGALCFTVAAAAATFAMIRATDDGWASATVLGLFAAAAVALALFAAVEARVAHPLLELSLLRNRSFVGVLLAGLFVTLSAFAIFTYTSIWLQSFIGLSPIQAGLTGLPLSAAAFVASAVGGRVLHARAPGPVIAAGLLLVGVGGVLCALLVHRGSSWPALVPGLFVIGLGVGVGTPVLSSTAMATVEARRGGMAAGAVNTARQLGYAFGIALLGSVFASRVQHALAAAGVPGAAPLSHAIAGGQSQGILRAAGDRRAELEDVLHRAFASGLDAGFWVAGLAGIAAGLAVLALVRSPAPRLGAPAATESTAGRETVADAPPDHVPEPAAEVGPTPS